MNDCDYYFVEIPEQGFAVTFMGTIKPADPGFVWLCKPDGTPLVRVPELYVTKSSQEEAVQRVIQDAKVERQHYN